MAELKKLADDRSALLEEAEQSKKKLSRDMETLQGRVDELSANNSKLEKTRKRLQDEVRVASFFSKLLAFWSFCGLKTSDKKFSNIWLLVHQVDDVQLNLEKERAAVSALEKKQRKFDQVCATLYLYALWVENFPSETKNKEFEGWGTEKIRVKFLYIAKDKLKCTVLRNSKKKNWQIPMSHFAEC